MSTYLIFIGPKKKIRSPDPIEMCYLYVFFVHTCIFSMRFMYVGPGTKELRRGWRNGTMDMNIMGLSHITK
jgi:hypothetical protein